MSSGPLCPECGRPTVVMVFLIICASCKYAAKPHEFYWKQIRAEEKEAVEGAQ